MVEILAKQNSPACVGKAYHIQLTRYCKHDNVKFPTAMYVHHNTAIMPKIVLK